MAVREKPNFEKSLYVACALNGAPKDSSYVGDVEVVKNELEVVHNVNVLKFLGLGDFTPTEVFETDIEMARNCSAFLGIYGYTSDGRGMETITAISRGIPCLGVVERGLGVSKMITGCFEVHGMPFVEVESIVDEVPELVIRHFRELQDVL